MVEAVLSKRKVEEGIEEFGCEFREWSDNCFWYEYDAQFRLLSILSSKSKDPRILHAHFPSDENKARHRKRYDIAIFDESVADDIVKQDFPFDKWPDRITNREVATAIEVAFAWVHKSPSPLLWTYKEDIRKAIDRLVNHPRQLGANKGNTHYVVICCVTKAYGERPKKRPLAKTKFVSSAIECIQCMAHKLCSGQPITVKIYWTADQGKPRWIYPTSHKRELEEPRKCGRCAFSYWNKTKLKDVNK